MPVIGYAALPVIPSIRGVQGQLSKQLAGEMQTAGNRGGAALSGALSKWTKRAAGFGGAIAAGLTIKGGVARLLQIDDATAKLKGLGLTSKGIARVQANVDKAVTGTAFSMSEGMTAATTAMSSGVKAGSELERYLSLIGDVATQGGTSYQEMASIINQVQARGKVGQENLNRLTERGIGIQSMLAKYYGVSGEELQEMLRKGQVSAGDFQKVLEKNFAGSAQKAGDTVRGSFANMRTSFSRLGAILAGPIFAKLPTLFQGVTSGIKGIAKEGGPAQRIGSLLGSAFAVVADAVGKALGWMRDNKTVVATFAGVILTVVGAMKAWAAVMAVVNAVVLANPISLIVVAIAALAAGLVYAYKHSDRFRSVVDTTWAVVKAAVSATWTFLKPIFSAIGSVIGAVLPKAFAFFKGAVGIAFRVIGTYVKTWWAVAKVVFTAVKWYVSNVLAPVFSWLWKNIIRPVFTWIGSKVKAVWNGIVKPAFSAMKTGIGRVGSAFGAAKDAIGRAWGKVQGIIEKPLRGAIGIVNRFLKAINRIPGVKLPYISFGGAAAKAAPKGVAQGALMRRATGGSVFGPGTGTSDSIPALLSNSEHVWTAREVSKAGGHGVVERLRNMALHGALPRFAKGGAVVPGRGNRHSGYPWATYAGDFPNPIGTPVRAWKDGVIAMVRSLTTSYGKHIRMNHTDGTSSLYAHLSSFAKSVGDKVKQGQMIGRVGSTGNSTGPHLHFESMGGPYKGGPGRGGSIWDKITGSVGNLTSWVGKQMSATLNMKDGGFFGNLTPMLRHIGGQVRDWVKAKVFDSGGLASGTGLLAKATRQPERVLSPRQTAAFERAMASGFAGRADGGYARLHPDDIAVLAEAFETGTYRASEASLDNYDEHQGRLARMGAR